MTTTINASTSSGLVVTPDNSGNIQLQYNGVAAPAFRAYNNATQNITVSTWTKVSLQVEDFDTANCFDSTTNYRFTPTVAGYYQVSGSVNFNYNGADGNLSRTAIYKNGSVYSQAANRLNTNGGPYESVNVTDLIYLNGTTDYIELYAISSNGSPFISSSASGTRFSACLLRGA